MPNLNTWLFVRKRQLTLQENPKKKKKKKRKEKPFLRGFGLWTLDCSSRYLLYCPRFAWESRYGGSFGFRGVEKNREK